jgi:sugar (pentulose or hexulose) kinase
MAKTPVILIFDVGKTNKKVLLFNEQYRLVFEEGKKFEEIKDEDGFPCEDILALTDWVKDSFQKIAEHKEFEIKAVNFSAYGASFVYVDRYGEVITPLFNYLKPYPEVLRKKFYSSYGGESLLSKQTASPVLGNLNSGLQLYKLKHEKPEVFDQIAFALHLPQYLSYILVDYPATDITSIGCHTKLWDFQEKKYHKWVEKEGIDLKFAPLISCQTAFNFENDKKKYFAGVGLHDSSSALIPYLISFNEPFVLLSTGTWCITLNPYNNTMLSDYELDEDCLCYLSYEGKPVKASRLFAGYEHEQQVKRLADFFKKSTDHYSSVKCDLQLLAALNKKRPVKTGTNDNRQSDFQFRKLEEFSTYEDAYHQLIADIMKQQVRSTNLVLKGAHVKRIFVDGGFSKNPIYMYLLAEAFPKIEVYAASVPQASALGAALAIHQHWNTKKLPSDIIDLKLYSVTQGTKV